MDHDFKEEQLANTQSKQNFREADLIIAFANYLT